MLTEKVVGYNITSSTANDHHSTTIYPIKRPFLFLDYESLIIL